VYALSYNTTNTEIMIYIRNADKFDPANAIEIGMITSPNGWSGLWDGISYNALKTGGFIEQTQKSNHFAIISEGAIKLLSLDYGHENIVLYDLYSWESFVNLAAIIPSTSPSTLVTVTYNYESDYIRLDLLYIDGTQILSRTTIQLDYNVYADVSNQNAKLDYYEDSSGERIYYIGVAYNS
jgi:hypothetical protein